MLNLWCITWSVDFKRLIQHLVSSLYAVSDRPVHRLRENCSSLSTCTPDGHLLTVTIPDAVLIQFDLLRIARYCSKHVHVEDCNKCIKNLCIKLVIGWGYTEMHGQRNIKALRNVEVWPCIEVCHFVWVWNLVSHMKGRTYMECVQERGTEENIGSYKGSYGRTLHIVCFSSPGSLRVRKSVSRNNQQDATL